ncbi:pilus assembly protein [Neisseria gonorrhoeae]|nr:pilus assembly protein [Neisseria gonorrhoeae]UYA77909.1 pilus assembly protein [Neisseria gonorrhoeae]
MTMTNPAIWDIVNSPITAVGGYLATAANDGMVHLFKKTAQTNEATN